MPTCPCCIHGCPSWVRKPKSITNIFPSKIVVLPKNLTKCYHGHIMLFLGVLLLLICTPLGFARLFTIVGDLVVSPVSARNLDEEYLTLAYEEDCLRQKVSVYEQTDSRTTENGGSESLGSISSR